MRQAPAFEADDWLGSLYELCIEYQPAGDDARLRRALEALWRVPLLGGPWSGRDYRERGRLDDPTAFGEGPRWHGLLPLPGYAAVGCFAVVVREGDRGDEADPPDLAPVPGAPVATLAEGPHADWLDVCLPLGMLGRAFPVVWPLDAAANPWLDVVNAALLRMAEAVYAVAPSDLAIIGEEVSGYRSRQTVTAADADFGGVLASPALAEQLRSAARPPVVLASGLRWYPYTTGVIGFDLGTR